MTLIIGCSGKKKSGKDTVAKFAYNKLNDVIESQCFISHVVPLKCRIYHYATKLKEFCRDYFLIDEKLLWGTDDDKNTKIPYILWENMPGYSDFVNQKVITELTLFQLKIYDCFDSTSVAKKYAGAMSVREILQYWGTEVCRKAWPCIWVQSCMRQIEQDNPSVALLADARFPDEMDAIKQKNGFTVRLTRNVAGNDTHASETSLGDYKFDHVIDNANLTLEATQEAFNNYVLGLL